MRFIVHSFRTYFTHFPIWQQQIEVVTQSLFLHLYKSRNHLLVTKVQQCVPNRESTVNRKPKSDPILFMFSFGVTHPDCGVVFKRLKSLIFREKKEHYFFFQIQHEHTVRNLHFLSKNSTLISRENCRILLGEKLVKMLWFRALQLLTTLISQEKLSKTIWVKNS